MDGVPFINTSLVGRSARFYDGTSCAIFSLDVLSSEASWEGLCETSIAQEYQE